MLRCYTTNPQHVEVKLDHEHGIAQSS